MRPCFPGETLFAFPEVAVARGCGFVGIVVFEGAGAGLGHGVATVGRAATDRYGWICCYASVLNLAISVFGDKYCLFMFL